MRGTLVAMAATLLLASPGAAAAHGGLDLLGGAIRLEGGLFEVPLRTGPPLITHGADPGGEGSTGQARRPPMCATTHHQQVFLGRPVAAPDRLDEAREVIEAAIWNMNAELDRAALESGGVHADYRVRCGADGQLAIATFVNLRTSSFRDVVDAARLAGAVTPEVNYTIFYDDPAAKGCGTGSFVADDQPGEANDSNAGGGYAVVYPRCWDAATVMHENGHNMGAVHPGAPNATGAQAHCRDESDVMCYADGAEGPAGMRLDCPGGERFDCGYDDYFDAGPEPGEYLATHWNLGSRANRFIAFSDPLPGEGASVLGCVESDGPLLAADTLGCVPEPEPEPEEEAEEEEADPAVRILAAAQRGGDVTVRARLLCPRGRRSPCSGRVQLARRVTRGSHGRTFRISPGASAEIRIRLAGSARRAWRRGALRRIWVVARADDASADAARRVRLRR